MAWGVSGIEGVSWKSSQGTSVPLVRAGSGESISSKNWGGEENALSFGGVAVPSDVDSKTKGRKVTVDEGKSFGQGIAGGKGEGAIIDI